MQQLTVKMNEVDGCMWICKAKGGSMHSSVHVHVKSNRLLHVHSHVKSSIHWLGIRMSSHRCVGLAVAFACQVLAIDAAIDGQDE